MKNKYKKVSKYDKDLQAGFKVNKKPDRFNKNKLIKCNICGIAFSPENKYERYCEDCRSESDLFQYSDWF